MDDGGGADDDDATAAHLQRLERLGAAVAHDQGVAFDLLADAMGEVDIHALEAVMVSDLLGVMRAVADAAPDHRTRQAIHAAASAIDDWYSWSS